MKDYSRWEKEDIERLIIDGVEENINLEYKAYEALNNTDGKKKEISKDVSSFANSDGGLIVYGVKEYDQRDKRHLPESVQEGYDPAVISKEWLEHVIVSNIRPKIDGLIIKPIATGVGNKVIFLVIIPKGLTAHQAKDYRYYRRYNFQSVPMDDYEIRDIMNRRKQPLLEPKFTYRLLPGYTGQLHEYEMHIELINKGTMLINLFRLEVSFPAEVLVSEHGCVHKETFFENIVTSSRQTCGVEYTKLSYTNPSTISAIFPNEEFKLLPSSISPVRNLTYKFTREIRFKYYSANIFWKLYADEMPYKEGALRLRSLAEF
jgi:hypothetical protein